MLVTFMGSRVKKNPKCSDIISLTQVHTLAKIVVGKKVDERIFACFSGVNHFLSVWN